MDNVLEFDAEEQATAMVAMLVLAIDVDNVPDQPFPVGWASIPPTNLPTRSVFHGLGVGGLDAVR